MADKTTFSDSLQLTSKSEILKGQKACANCSHARIEMNPQLVREVVTCKALPKFPVAVPVPQGNQMGIGIRFYHPTMELHEECDLFEFKNGSANGKKDDPEDVLA